MSFWIMCSVGVLLVILEIFLGSFFLLFFGLGFLAVAFLGLLTDFAWFGIAPLVVQAILICAISLCLLLLRKPIKRLFRHSQELGEDFLDSGGEGEIREGMAYFKGTLWKIQGDASAYTEGQKVRIKSVKNNRVEIED